MKLPIRYWFKQIITLLCAGMIAFVGSAQAGKPETPISLAGALVITAEKAKSMIDRGVLIVDARVANEYVEEHIQGAINIPYKEKSEKKPDFDARKDKFNLAMLPTDKSTNVIFYCNAGKCWKSYKACTTAIKAGYKNVYWLRGGIPEWKSKAFPVE